MGLRAGQDRAGLNGAETVVAVGWPDDSAVGSRRAIEVAAALLGRRLTRRSGQHVGEVEHLLRAGRGGMGPIRMRPLEPAIAVGLVPGVRAREPADPVAAAGKLKLVTIELEPIHVVVHEKIELGAREVRMRLSVHLGRAENVLEGDRVADVVVDLERGLLEVLQVARDVVHAGFVLVELPARATGYGALTIEADASGSEACNVVRFRDADLPTHVIRDLWVDERLHASGQRLCFIVREDGPEARAVGGLPKEIRATDLVLEVAGFIAGNHAVDEPFLLVIRERPLGREVLAERD